MPREHVESSLFKMLETYLSNFYALSTPTLSPGHEHLQRCLLASAALWVLQSSWSGTGLWFGWWFLPPSVNASNLSNKTVFIFLRQQCCPSGFAQTLLNLGTSQGLVLVENLSLHMLSVRLLMTFFSLLLWLVGKFLPLVALCTFLSFVPDTSSHKDAKCSVRSFTCSLAF